MEFLLFQAASNLREFSHAVQQQTFPIKKKSVMRYINEFYFCFVKLSKRLHLSLEGLQTVETVGLRLQLTLESFHTSESSKFRLMFLAVVQLVNGSEPNGSFDL